MAYRCIFLLLSIGLCFMETSECRKIISSKISSRIKRDSEPVHSTKKQTITAYLNGAIYTVDNENEPNWDKHPKEAIVIKEKEILFIGSSVMADKMIKTLESNQPNDYNFNIYDIQGHVILPGFHDIHIHPLESMSEIGGTCILPSNTDPDAQIIKDILTKCAPNQKGTEWILGGGHSITNLLDYIQRTGLMPKDILDNLIPNKPIIMMEETSHSVWVNSEALRRAGINNDTPVRNSGIIMRAANGEPNGILLENEGLAIMDMALNITQYPELEKYNYEGLILALSELAKHGITSICDARVYWKRGHQISWQKACDEDMLIVRVILDLWAYPHANDTEQIQTLKDMHSDGDKNCLLKKSQVKVYSDGLLDSYTAAMLQPYSSVLQGMPGIEENKGLNYFSQTRLAKYIKELQLFVDKEGIKRRFDFNVHAIGDRGTQETLNAVELSADPDDKDTRHRLTHVEIIDPNDLPRFSKLNVIADFQVAGEFAIPTEDYLEHLDYIIGERANNFIVVKDVRDSNGFTTFSSDWDVSPLNPFLGIERSGQRGNQSVDVKTAVEMYTINAAYAMRQENVVGSLVLGKEADLIIINQNIFKPLPEGFYINATIVLQTVLQGKPVYTHPYFSTSISTVTNMFISNMSAFHKYSILQSLFFISISILLYSC